MSVTTAKKLAKYICDKYFDCKKRDISPVRLQKTLYFCFAFWGGFVEKGNYQNTNVNEIDVSNQPKYLYDEEIQAWVYGPVIPSVYFDKNICHSTEDISDIFKNNELAEQVVNNVIKDSINFDDFKLVEMAHMDEAWKRNFIYEEEYHNREIPKEDIIKEYARR